MSGLATGEANGSSSDGDIASVLLQVSVALDFFGGATGSALVECYLTVCRVGWICVSSVVPLLSWRAM